MIHKPYKQFKGWLLSNDLTYADIAEVLGISTTTLSYKISGKSDFTLAEINVLIDKYKKMNLTIDIFFENSVA